MNIEYLLGFLCYLEREHGISLVKEELSDWGDGCSSLHTIDHETQKKLASEYRNYVINTGLI